MLRMTNKTSITRLDAAQKVTGSALYTADLFAAAALYAKSVCATLTYAKIKKLDTSRALVLPGVAAVITGEDYAFLTGPSVMDRPALARGIVRYYGEPLALVVADSPFTASQASLLVKAELEPLTPVLSVSDALSPRRPVLHENLAGYRLTSADLYPEPGTNVCDRKQIRKGDIEKGFAQCAIIVEERFTLPQSGHMPMETHAASARVTPDGTVHIRTSTQAPFVVRKTLADIFGLPESRITVETPYVGGGFGGKTGVFLEILAYLGSLAAGGREVCIIGSREDDISSAPCRIGLESIIKLGATADGKLRAAQLRFLLDTGAYAEAGPRIAKAIAADCTGPYDIANVWCDSLSVYTNHTPATAFRGFGHLEMTFCIERTIDALAEKLGMDSAALRLKNAVKPGAWAPTAVKLDKNSVGDVAACIKRAEQLIGWDGGGAVMTAPGIVRAKGLACFWKAPAPPSDAVSGALITFNYDGSVNLNCGCCEIGPAMKTTAARIVAGTLRMDISRVSVNMDVNTSYAPEHWETAASLTTHMLGIAAYRAALDAKRQLIKLAAGMLGYPTCELDLYGERVALLSDPGKFVETKKLAQRVIGRGVFSFEGIRLPDKDTGSGKTGPHRTVGAQAVELEFDEREYTYRLLNAVSVIDAGKIIDHITAEAVVRGGMCMGLSVATRESFVRDDMGRLLNTSFRTYKVMHFGQTPGYCVEFVERPGLTSPHDSYGLAEHGLIAVPAAFCAALSHASGLFLRTFPMTPETVWREKEGGS